MRITLDMHESDFVQIIDALDTIRKMNERMRGLPTRKLDRVGIIGGVLLRAVEEARIADMPEKVAGPKLEQRGSGH